MIDLEKYIKSQEEEYLELFKDIIELESPTHDKKAVDQLVDFIEGYLKEQNVEVTRVYDEKYGDQLVGEWGDGEEQIMFLGHIDTVWDIGTTNRLPFVIRDGVIKGPGVYDMKGGVFQGLFALKVMNELKLQPKYKVVFLINTDEEVSTPSSRKLIQEVASESKYVFVAEPADVPEASVKTSRRGIARFILEIKGIAAHSGANADEGASAIHEFARQVLYLESLANKEKCTNINVGVVNGGTRPNVVAANVRAEIDVRIRTLDEANRVIPLIQKLAPVDPRTEVKVVGGLTRPPMERTEKIAELFYKIKEIANVQGFVLNEKESFGGSDANITAALGIPTICGLGVVGQGAHSVDEHCLLEYIPQRIAFLINIFMKV